MDDSAAQNALEIEKAKLRLQAILRGVDQDAIFTEMRRAKGSAEECRRMDSAFAAEKYEEEARLLGRLATIAAAGGIPDIQPDDFSLASLAELHIGHPGVRSAADEFVALSAMFRDAAARE